MSSMNEATSEAKRFERRQAASLAATVAKSRTRKSEAMRKTRSWEKRRLT